MTSQNEVLLEGTPLAAPELSRELKLKISYSAERIGLLI